MHRKKTEKTEIQRKWNKKNNNRCQHNADDGGKAMGEELIHVQISRRGRARAFVFLHHLPLVLREQESIDLWRDFLVVRIIHSYLALFFGNGSIWSIILWWILSMLLKDHLVHTWKAAEGLLPSPQPCFSALFLEWFCPNYQPKVVFTVVGDFDSLVFEAFLCRLH